MIIVKLMGGLGNQMFQYALGRHLAEKNQVVLKMDLAFLKDRTARPDFTYRDYELHIFNIKESFASATEVEAYCATSKNKVKQWIYALKQKLRPVRYHHEHAFNFDPLVLNAPQNTYLEGYWQSEKYFKAIAPIIRNEFSIRHEINHRVLPLYDLVRNGNAVSIHIRRGDFVANKGINQFHGVCSLDYYYRAIEIMEAKIPDPQFFVFSDDIQWAKENLKFSSPHFFALNDQSVPAYEDMRLMSLCKHQIIANSSFSWWAAWLNNNENKLVIAPERWFNDSSVNTSDIIPEGWMKI